MEKSSEDKEVYTPPTREAVLASIYSDGIYSAKCRICGEKIRGKNIKELEEHKCRD